ncbi:MAG TPA: cytochrome-c oxidase, cbb3-type subunit II, partial [Thiomonas arsenitoxydans]|nr:cytochrome-c oxidase, cbb3-type subunit II [Thiomonas arsenitoxydans]
GVPYTEAEIAAAPQELEGKTKEDALIAYLQGLGTALSNYKSKANYINY